LRLIASIGDYLYTVGGETVYIHQYMESEAECSMSGHPIRIVQHTQYPWNGDIKITIYTSEVLDGVIALRIPGWCENATVNRDYTERDGYWHIRGKWKDGDEIALSLTMDVLELEANPMVAQNSGKVALRRGPFIYCAEEADNPDGVFDLVIEGVTEFSVEHSPELLGGIHIIRFNAMRKKPFKELYRKWNGEYDNVEVVAIPYHLWGNRGDGDMQVWMNKR
jgi:DUF1680 family protein